MTEPRIRVVATDGDARRETFAEDVRRGLTATPKTLPCVYFYDAKGSQLFEAICELPEYYLTRAEAEILSTSASDIVDEVGAPVELVELGSGSATKTRFVIEAILARQDTLHYRPIDISRAALDDSAGALGADFPRLTIDGIEGEYAEGIRRLRGEAETARLILFLGSNIGNMSPDEAVDFLSAIRANVSARDAMLIGMDLRKDAGVLERAYDDSQGITAAFNMNVLERVNRELRGDFDLGEFRHAARYDDVEGRVEMHLVSCKAQTAQVAVLGLEVEFAEGETIHTENSYKYGIGQIDDIARRAGWEVRRRWLDARQQFSVNLFAPVTTPGR
ncbi:L-histidine N(alpha)-methyltransferase [Candidatus Poribacteria bacterium]|nr:L-histidine N(alpha)-methyltransferase [Candidatus Poribacteria bacterium]MBT5534977.1 L-histidine N(alpha)-methyltransferase [Candidatus Poribacteria bacterium]MBT5711787.1 L-histidine N(alpha)-methyltransferase [Candidatus Poribacteria bacterium]MBT7100014.1 L-histidine N(alpha)-methyltransferase [Candidatus Poribacteria bacterium]MBT7809246.1 L-histidine N(alpha)-methyltransferase [Candidatus Poribacteria bacterium]